MKGKCNDPFRRIQEEDTEGGGGGGGVLVEWHSAVSSSFCGVDREGKGKAREREGEGRRSEKGGGRGGARNVASVSLSARGPYTEGRYRGGGSPPLRIVYRRRFKKGMTFYRAARSISRAREWREVRLFFSAPSAAAVRNDLVAATLSGASTENTIPFTNVTFYGADSR